MPVVALAQSPAVQFQVPAGPLETTLPLFAAQSGEQILYSTDLVAGRQSPGVSGALRTDQALAALLQGTGLRARRTSPNTLVVYDPDARADATDEAVEIEDVVVTGSLIRGVADGPSPVVTVIRGAVTVGDLYHDEQLIVGPAMVRAYELESKSAKYPRVIIDPEALEVGRSHRSNRHSRREESAYLESFLLEDDDGWMFFDWFSWKVVVEAIGADDQAYPNYLARLAATIKTGLAHPVAACAEKYLWVRRHYLRALDHLAEANPEHRRLNPEFWEVADGLPRLKKRAAKAKARVAAARAVAQARR